MSIKQALEHTRSSDIHKNPSHRVKKSPRLSQSRRAQKARKPKARKPKAQKRLKVRVQKRRRGAIKNLTKAKARNMKQKPRKVKKVTKAARIVGIERTTVRIVETIVRTAGNLRMVRTIVRKAKKVRKVRIIARIIERIARAKQRLNCITYIAKKLMRLLPSHHSSQLTFRVLLHQLIQLLFHH